VTSVACSVTVAIVATTDILMLFHLLHMPNPMLLLLLLLLKTLLMLLLFAVTNSVAGLDNVVLLLPANADIVFLLIKLVMALLCRCAIPLPLLLMLFISFAG
jgi:hypothetical protein